MLCPKCGKENQEHYRFCLGCGGELAQAAEPLKAAPPRAQAEGADPARAATLLEASDNKSGTQAAHAAESTPCAQCGHPNPPQFVFCGSCGGMLQDKNEASAPKGQPAPSSGAPRSVARLALIRPDGSEGGTHVVMEPEAIIGRQAGPMFASDRYLSPQHARMTRRGDTLVLEDVGSLNGVFVRISEDEQLRSGNVFRIGQELLRFDAISSPQPRPDGTEILGSPNPGYWGRLSLLVGRNVEGSAFPLMGDHMVLGRERGDILFSDDGYVSAMHAKIALTNDHRVILTDLGSSNGTFIKLRQPRPVVPGTFVLMGQQLFRIEKA